MLHYAKLCFLTFANNDCQAWLPDLLAFSLEDILNVETQKLDQ